MSLTGYGGGFNERENLVYNEREESDGEYDEVSGVYLFIYFFQFVYHFSQYILTETCICTILFYGQFGRIKKKYRGKSTKDTEKKEEPKKNNNNNEEEEEEDEDDEDGDLSKYKLDVRDYIFLCCVAGSTIFCFKLIKSNKSFELLQMIELISVFGVFLFFMLLG